MQDFRNLEVWQRAHQITLQVYRMTREFPKEELYGLVSQVRRCAVSIPTNIAEGCVKQSDAEFRRFAFISLGSISELDYLIMLSKELNFAGDPSVGQLKSDLDSVRRMLISLIQRLGTSSPPGSNSSFESGPQPTAQSPRPLP